MPTRHILRKLPTVTATRVGNAAQEPARLNKAMRDLDRERLKMEQQEKRLSLISKTCERRPNVKIMAKDLVRTRRYVRKFMLMKANIQAVSLKIQTLKSREYDGAGDARTRAMATMNRQLNMPQIQRILQEFEKQSEIMDMKEEMMNESIDDAMEGDEDEEESDAVVGQILDELGLQLNDQLSGLPQTTGSLSVAGKTPAASAGRRWWRTGGGAALNDADAELQARLDNLRRIVLTFIASAHSKHLGY
ncbi:Charged multivesicular body protein 2a [Eumeta japonica]|uniref:Charged multivesicular body protein 2a n=1 Tax=Eumeta variegata TaxID=151549 RepID=A0A4C2AH99_EUMVA|nr:Charged multivesicular body protein 2a [Eumeta japonica]